MAKPFRMDQYKTYEGAPGNPREWKAAFNATMGVEEAKSYVGRDTPEGILGVAVGSVWPVIVSAYKAAALATHPDRCASHGLPFDVATEKFKRVVAAYTLLKTRYGR